MMSFLIDPKIKCFTLNILHVCYMCDVSGVEHDLAHLVVPLYCGGWTSCP